MVKGLDGDYLIAKLPNETDFEYIKKIVYGKLVYKTIDKDYEDLSELIFGEGNNYNSSEVRKRMYGIKHLIDVIEKENISKITDDNLIKEIEDKKLELQKEKYKFFDQRNAFNKELREEARFEELKNTIIENTRLINKDKSFINIDLSKKTTNKTGVLQLSDWHYGLATSNFLNEYNIDVFKKRVNKVVNKSIEYGTFNDIEEMYILLQGDFISSSIHHILRVQNQIDIITQIQITSEVIAEIINNISKNFKTKVAIVIDNHSRVTPDKKESLSEESYIRLTEWYLKTRLEQNKNVEFINNKYGLEISNFKIYDFNCGSVHGHNDSVKSIVQNLTTFTREIYDYIFVAHNHHPFIEEINMTTIIGNGSLCGVEAFSASLRRTSYPSQNFVLFNKDEGLENINIIKLD